MSANAFRSDGRVGEIDGAADFEVMIPSRLHDAVTDPKPKTTTRPYMSIFLSRVPLPEVRAKVYITCQSNEAQIEQQRQRQMGLL